MSTWRIVATVIILLLIILFIASTQPSVRDFFSSLTKKAGDVIENKQLPQENGSISFSLRIDNYAPITFQNAKADIVVESQSFSASIDNGNITSISSLTIGGFEGIITINGSTLSLDGSMKSLQTSTSSVSIPSKIKSLSDFTKLVLKGLYVRNFVADNATGNLVLSGADTRIRSKTITIENALGDFEFSGGALKINATSTSVKVPDIGIIMTA